MFVEKDEEKKIVYFWLSRQEKDDADFRESLKPQYAKCKSEGYTVCVFLSGSGSLFESTKNLLLHNRDLIMNEVQ